MNRFLSEMRLWAVALAALLACGCSSYAWKQKGPPPQWSDGKAPALEPLVVKSCLPLVEDYDSVGLAVAVVSPSGETMMTFGRPAIGKTQPVRGNSLYEIGSITKTFTALALEREIERGTMRLDQPVAELLPEGVTMPPAARGITLRQLVTHTSGFPALPGNFSYWHAIGKWMTTGNPYDGYSEAEFREGVAKVKLESKPGKEFAYSNFGMDLLGYVLAEKAGLDFENYIKREVCHPLGMSDTTVTLSAEQKKRFVQGYVACTSIGRLIQYDKASPWNLPSHLAGSGALRSSIEDMMIYLKANMHPSGELADAIRATHRELYRQKDGPAIGMNWIRSWNSQMKKVIIWHNGETGGYASFMGFTEDGRIGVVVLSNVADEDLDDTGGEILSALGKLDQGIAH